VSPTKVDQAAEIRAAAYRYGSSLRQTATSRRAAELAAFKLSQLYPPERFGIRFEGALIPETKDWAVYACTVPLLERGELWSDEAVDELCRRVQEWGTALVREFNTSGSAKTVANRSNIDLEARWPKLAAHGIRFKSQVVAPTAHGKGSFAVYAYDHRRESAALANLREAAAQ
jgi:hypothetical protein